MSRRLGEASCFFEQKEPKNFTPLVTRLQAAIAVVAARERALTVLLVAVRGRIGRQTSIGASRHSGVAAGRGARGVSRRRAAGTATAAASMPDAGNWGAGAPGGRLMYI